MLLVLFFGNINWNDIQGLEKTPFLNAWAFCEKIEKNYIVEL